MGKNGQNQDATASFSGYLYQADVALLFVLEKIKDMYSDSEEIQKWSFEVEGEEDFGIYKKEGGNISKKELYQVKEYESHQASKYTEAIMKLAQISKIQRCEHELFLVTQIEITEGKRKLNKNDLIEKLKHSTKGLKKFAKEEKKKEHKKTLLELKKDYCEYMEEDFDNDKFLKYIKDNVKWEIFENNFEYCSVGSFEEIKNKNLRNIKYIQEKIGNSCSNTENTLNFLESTIKKFIQKHKGIDVESREKISFNDIIGIISEENITFNAEISKDILVNFFIKRFIGDIEEINTSKPPYFGNIQILKESLRNDFEKFIEESLLLISEKIFINTEKTISFIKTIVANSEFDNIESMNKLDDLLKKVETIGNSRKHFLKVFLLYLYYSKNTGKKLDNLDGNDEHLYLREGDNIGKITGLSFQDEEIFNFLKTEIFYQFEFTHLGVNESNNGQTIKGLLGIIEVEEDFDEEIKEKHQQYGFNITKSFDIKFFSGNQYFKDNTLPFM